MIVPDLNLLVHAHSTGAPLHEPARRWWEELVNGTERVGVPWLVAAGFVRLLTHPSVLNTPAAPEDAVDLMAEWFRSPSVTPLNPGTQHITIFRNMLHAAGVGGGTSSPTPTSPRWPSSTRPRSTPTTATSHAFRDCDGATPFDPHRPGAIAAMESRPDGHPCGSRLTPYLVQYMACIRLPSTCPRISSDGWNRPPGRVAGPRRPSCARPSKRLSTAATWPQLRLSSLRAGATRRWLTG